LSLSIRAWLTLWYTAVLSLVLAIFAAAFYLVHARSRLSQGDDELARADGLVTRLLTQELDEGASLGEAARDALEDVDLPGRSVAVFDAAGTLLAGRWQSLPGAGAEASGERGFGTATIGTPDGALRVRRARHMYEETTYHVGVAESLVPLERELAGLRRALGGSVLLALLLAASGGWWIARAALQPVTRMAAQARRITDRTPGVRLSSPNPHDELGLLAGAFNDLLARLESALSQQRQFMADASHELRTPVSVSRTAIDVTLDRGGRSEDEYRESLGVVGEQMRRLTRIVEDLLTLARADAGGLRLEPKPVYIDELVADCVRTIRVIAESKAVALDCRGPGDVELLGDERWLRQMFVNLLDNAVRHTPAGERVIVELACEPDSIQLAVSDSGAGIAEAECERIFERFVRLDAARSGDGAGLGLSIARAIAEAHGGTLAVARSDSSGTTFLVRLPRPHHGA
jgi:two-component system, OmpR family, sensor kinase